MRVRHTVTRELEAQYRASLNRDLGVYHMQTGSGIGGFLGKLFKSLIPVGKSVFNAFKPELRKMGKKAITHVAATAYNKIGAKAPQKTTSKMKRKRRRDTLTSAPYKRT